MKKVSKSLLVRTITAYLIFALPADSSFQVGTTRRRPDTQRHRIMLMAAQATSTDESTLLQPSKRIQRTLDPCVVLMKEMIGSYAAEWKDRGGIYSLAQGVVYWKPPPSAQEALLEAIQKSNDPDDSLHMYGPDEGLLELREALQTKIRTENQLDNHHVMVTVGANQAFVNCVLTLLDSHDKAIVFKPYYFNHVMALQMVLSDAETQLLVGPSGDDGVPDLDWLETQLQADDSIRMVTMTNPCNPTGVLLERSVVQRAVDVCRKHNVWLVLDCTYEYFLPSDGNANNFDGCFSDAHVIHVFSMSKAYALAGYRCGYMVMSKNADPLYQQVLKVQDTIPICPSRISQVAALGSLQAGREWVREKVATLSTGRDAILRALAPCSQVMGGSGAMYFMCKLGSDDDADDEEFARRLVKDYGVAVIPGSYCGYPGWLRVCYANLPPDDCLKAADRLALGLKELLAKRKNEQPLEVTEG